MAAALGRVFTLSEPRSVAAFERRARAETALLGIAAALALLSVVVSLRNMEFLPGVGAAELEGPAMPAEERPQEVASAAVPSTDPQTQSTRAALAPSAPTEALLDEPVRAARRAPAERAAWRESDFHAEFSALTGTEELSQRAAGTLVGAGPRAEQMAALQVSFERHGGAAADLFVQAALVLPDDSDRRGESVPRAAIHWLGERAPCQPAARSVLEAVALAREVSPELRAASVRALVSALPEEELPRVAAHFARERDEIVHASAQAALDSRLDDTPQTTEAQQE